MADIDQIQIHFEPGKLFFLNICLAFLLFGVALDIQLEDFRKVFRSPRGVWVGLLSQYLLLPILTVLLVLILRPAPSIALGMILVAACPGGNVSNYMVHLSKGNTALSVLLTSFSTLTAFVVTPLSFSFFSGLVPWVQELRATVQVEPWQLVSTILLLVVAPLIVGLAFQRFLPGVTLAVRRPVKWLSMALFLGLIAAVIAGNFENIRSHLHLVFGLVLAHNALALAGGYFFARAFSLSGPDARAISIETGIQNSGLGLILVFNFFNGLGGMAMILAWWGVWHLISGTALAFFWGRKGRVSYE